MESTGFVSAAMGGFRELKGSIPRVWELYLQRGLIVWEKGAEPWVRQADRVCLGYLATFWNYRGQSLCVIERDWEHPGYVEIFSLLQMS